MLQTLYKDSKSFLQEPLNVNYSTAHKYVKTSV